MAPEYASREVSGVTIIDLPGLEEDWAKQLRTTVRSLADSGNRNVILNLKNVETIGSIGLGEIVGSFTVLARNAGQLKLVNPSKPLFDLLSVTRLVSIFDVFTDEADAIASFLPTTQFRHPYLLHQDDASRVAKQSLEGRDQLSVFMCHSSIDKPWVREFKRRLEDVGISPWLDEEKILPGQDWDREIQLAIRAADALIAFISVKAFSTSGYLQKEMKQALDVADQQPEGSIFLIPARLEECEVPDRLRRWQWVDLFSDQGLNKLVTALQARALALGRMPLKPLR